MDIHRPTPEYGEHDDKRLLRRLLTQRSRLALADSDDLEALAQCTLSPGMNVLLREAFPGAQPVDVSPRRYAELKAAALQYPVEAADTLSGHLLTYFTLIDSHIEESNDRPMKLMSGRLTTYRHLADSLMDAYRAREPYEAAGMVDSDVVAEALYLYLIGVLNEPKHATTRQVAYELFFAKVL